MHGEHPNHADMSLAGWAGATSRLLVDVEDFLEVACKAIQKERLRRFGETRLDSTEARILRHEALVASLARAV